MVKASSGFFEMTRRKSDSRSETTVTESNLIYHYTSVDSLKGIVEGNCFWASDLNAVNDPAELIHVRTSLSNICRTLGRCAQEIEDYDPFEQYVFEVGEELSTLEREHDWVDLAGRVYGVSFCQQGDLLSQWHAYGLHGNGVCLGFDRQVLESCFGSAVTLTAVEYSLEKRDAYLEGMLDGAFKRYCEERRRVPSEELNAISSMIPMLVDLSGQSHRFKLPAFSEEQEIRLVAHIPTREEVFKRVHVRTRGLKVLPYIVLEPSSGPLPLRRIITGPAYDSAVANYALEASLSRSGYPPINIDSSKYSLRNSQ